MFKCSRKHLLLKDKNFSMPKEKFQYLSNLIISSQIINEALYLTAIHQIKQKGNRTLARKKLYSAKYILDKLVLGFLSEHDPDFSDNADALDSVNLTKPLAEKEKDTDDESEKLLVDKAPPDMPAHYPSLGT
ncbi:MAG: hypothetical protein ACFFDN_00790 [Candidatus Hodarchaeota archaeon]